MARPTGVGPATEHLLAAKLRQDFCIDMDREAGIEIDCDEAGTVWLRRTGLKDVDLTGAVSAKIEVKGFNITVRERITPGKYGDQPVDSALFELDFLASERYYLRYEAESISMSATLAFRNTAGYHASAVLRR